MHCHILPTCESTNYIFWHIFIYVLNGAEYTLKMKYIQLTYVLNDAEYTLKMKHVQLQNTTEEQTIITTVNEIIYRTWGVSFAKPRRLIV